MTYCKNHPTVLAASAKIGLCWDCVKRPPKTDYGQKTVSEFTDIMEMLRKGGVK